MMKSLSSILVTAYAKAPQGTAMYENYKHAGIVLEIDSETHKIIDAEFTFITNLAQNFFKRLIIGYDFSSNLDKLVERIEMHYFAPSTGSVIVALKSAQKRYLEKIGLGV
ncbi:DUF3870 domain-containing protein [Rummeliibacillus sp. JY-2-4R]